MNSEYFTSAPTPHRVRQILSGHRTEEVAVSYRTTQGLLGLRRNGMTTSRCKCCADQKVMTWKDASHLPQQNKFYIYYPHVPYKTKLKIWDYIKLKIFLPSIATKLQNEESNYTIKNKAYRQPLLLQRINFQILDYTKTGKKLNYLK